MKAEQIVECWHFGSRSRKTLDSPRANSPISCEIGYKECFKALNMRSGFQSPSSASVLAGRIKTGIECNCITRYMFSSSNQFPPVKNYRAFATVFREHHEIFIYCDYCIDPVNFSWLHDDPYNRHRTHRHRTIVDLQCGRPDHQQDRAVRRTR